MFMMLSENMFKNFRICFDRVFLFINFVFRCERKKLKNFKNPNKNVILKQIEKIKHFLSTFLIA